MKSRKNQPSSGTGFEDLEDRRLFSAASFSDGVLTLAGNTNQNNSIYVRAANGQRVFGVVNDRGEAAPLDGITKIVVKLGNEKNLVVVGSNITTPVEAISPDGTVQWLKAGTQQVITPGGAVTPAPIVAKKPAITPPVSNPVLASTPPAASQGATGSTSVGTTAPVTTVNPGSASSTGATTGTGSTTTDPGTTPTGTGGTTATGSGSTSTTTAGTGTTATPTSTNAPQPIITVTAGATLLPGESVHVKALSSTFGTGTVLNSKIQWNFGDPNSQYNDLVGFNAAHAYDTPGTYTVTLTITAPDGQSSSSTTQVTVNQDTRNTIYIAANGNDANDGSSAADPIQSIARLTKLLTSNTRVLFNSGDTFDTTTGININGYHDVFIGSYGTGKQPVLMYTGGETTVSMIASQIGTQGLVVQGLTFDSIYTDPSNEAPFASALRLAGNNITVRDNTFLNMYFDIDMSPVPTNVLIVNNTSPSPTGLRKYFAWVQGNDIAIVGNTVNNSTIESIIRVGGANDLLLAENNITNLADAGGNSKDIAKSTLCVQKGTYAYVYDNVLNGGSTGVGPMDNNYPASVSDQGATFDYSVWDGNQITNSDLLIQPAAQHVMVENNVINTVTGGIIINSTNPLFPTRQAEDVYIVHNTVINSGKAAGFLDLNGQAQNVNVDNNLFIAPNFIAGSGGATIYVADKDMSSFSEIKDNVWAAPQTISWIHGGNFYVGASIGVQADYLTPSQWEGTGIPTGDVYQNVMPQAGTYTINANDFVAGATLPQAA